MSDRHGDAAGEGGASGGAGERPARLLFVCAGNTCRSPMAEAMARRAAERRGLALEARSAGAAAVPGSAASTGAMLAAREEGLDLSGHVSARLGPELAGWADLVVCMTPAQARAAAELTDEEDVVLLTDFLPEDDPERGEPVGDPAGAGLEVYREVLQLVHEAVEGLVERVARR